MSAHPPASAPVASVHWSAAAPPAARPERASAPARAAAPAPVRPPAAGTVAVIPPPMGRAEVPAISPLLLRWFTGYCRRYIRRHFHAVRVSQTGAPPDVSGWPLVVYTNHASWWDPLVGLLLKAELFPNRSLYAPIDAAMLARYRRFARLGFFGVARDRNDQANQRGAAQFLRTADAILKHPNCLLAITPQGRFTDVRTRPLRFQSGLGHLAARVERALFLPVACEFVFWNERLPEILVRFGEPVAVVRGVRADPAAPGNPSRPGAIAGATEPSGPVETAAWTRLFEQKLEATQEALAEEARRRAPADFHVVLRGGAGQGGIYDWWRRWRARLRGEPFTREHDVL